jgi:hypothetical protein
MFSTGLSWCSPLFQAATVRAGEKGRNYLAGYGQRAAIDARSPHDDF